MFGRLQKGFATGVGGGDVRRRASKLSVAVIAWRARIIRFPVGRHCSIEIYIGGHTWPRTFCGRRGQVAR